MDTTPHHHLLTLRDLLRFAVSRFQEAEIHFGHGSDNAWDEAVYLLLHTLHLPPDQLEPFLDARVLPDERATFLKRVQQRVDERLPAAYITGEAWLQGQRFIVNEHVIIPRSPISELLAEGLAPWVADPDAVTKVMDMCTGSGCLAILAAMAFPAADVTAVDLSPEALDVTRQNIALYQLESRITTVQSDLLDALAPDAYDLILCNPPYVNSDSMQTLPPEYLHEPQMALAGGEDGMDIVRRLLQRAPDFLKPGGMLILEIGHEHDHFMCAFPELEPLWLSTAATDDQILMLTREQLTS